MTSFPSEVRSKAVTTPSRDVHRKIKMSLGQSKTWLLETLQKENKISKRSYMTNSLDYLQQLDSQRITRMTASFTTGLSL